MAKKVPDKIMSLSETAVFVGIYFSRALYMMKSKHLAVDVMVFCGLQHSYFTSRMSTCTSVNCQCIVTMQAHHSRVYSNNRVLDTVTTVVPTKC